MMIDAGMVDAEEHEEMLEPEDEDGLFKGLWPPINVDLVEIERDA
jgi:hypothetical protein